jgi:hypothetical protein
MYLSVCMCVCVCLCVYKRAFMWLVCKCIEDTLGIVFTVHVYHHNFTIHQHMHFTNKIKIKLQHSVRNKRFATPSATPIGSDL